MIECRGVTRLEQTEEATAARSRDARALASVKPILSGFRATRPETTFQIARLLRDLDRGAAGAGASAT